MSPYEIGITGICVLLLLLFLKMPIGFGLLLVGAIGVGVLKGVEGGFSVLATEPFRVAGTYVFTVIPLFILMGYLAAHTGLSEDAFFALSKWLGQLRGGLAMCCVGACTLFSAVSGDPISIAGTMSIVALPQMRKHGYKDRLSLGTLAASGNLGFLIPPSLAFIVYGIITEQSIGTLYIAGIVPGLLLAALFMITIFIRCKINPSIAPKAEQASWTEKIKASPRIIGMLVIIVIVLGGIYAGIFTPTEAGAAGVFGLLVIGLANRRLKWRGFTTSLTESARATGMIFILVMGAMVFSRFMAHSGLSAALTSFIGGLDIPRIYVLIAVMIAFILIGLILDIMAIVLIVVPILHPIMVGLGFDPIWFSVLVIINVLIGNVSPPFGIVVFALYGMNRGEIPLFTIYRGALPYIIAMAIGLIIVVAFPQMALWLPGMMRPG